MQAPRASSTRSPRSPELPRFSPQVRRNHVFVWSLAVHGLQYLYRMLHGGLSKNEIFSSLGNLTLKRKILLYPKREFKFRMKITHLASSTIVFIKF